jgi:2-polyprenyl-3-methyl-5-hydroxy-6-metoxy-1,4-benzoquinol methylase
MFKTLSNCRLCSGDFYNKTLRLKDTPPANELYPTRKEAREAQKFPLELVMCSKCKHVQLKHIVNPKRLFDDYVYKSGTSNFFINHFDKLAELISSKYPVNSYVLEVGSNDGILLSSLIKRNIKAVGVEPSEYLAKECITNNQVVYNSYFDEKTVNEILSTHGKASIVIGNNVFAHIEDLKEAFKNVSMMLDSDGLFIFEVAHLKYILTDGIFDTIYHEHMSYHTAISMDNFCKIFGFKIINIEKIPSHGGSLRFFLSKDLKIQPDNSVQETIEDEKVLALDSEKVLVLIEEKINVIKLSVNKVMSDFQAKSKSRFLGYGAPAKVVTFLAQMELEDTELIGVIDDNLSKQDKYLPGSGFEVKSTEQIKQILLKDEVARDFGVICFIFPWNLKAEIVQKLRSWIPNNSNAVVFFPTVEKVEI